MRRKASGKGARSGKKVAARDLPRKRGSAGAWARRFAGVAASGPHEMRDDARIDHCTKKYGPKEQLL
jgi:hypothetical protein